MFRQHYNVPTFTGNQSLKRSEGMTCVLSKINSKEVNLKTLQPHNYRFGAFYIKVIENQFV